MCITPRWSYPSHMRHETNILSSPAPFEGYLRSKATSVRRLPLGIPVKNAVWAQIFGNYLQCIWKHPSGRVKYSDLVCHLAWLDITLIMVGSASGSSERVYIWEISQANGATCPLLLLRQAPSNSLDRWLFPQVEYLSEYHKAPLNL